MRPCSVLPHVQPLPRAQTQIAVLHGNRFRRACECRARVRGHVVGPLGIVLPLPRLRGELRHPALEIAEHRGVRVLLDEQARRSVSTEHDADPALDSRSSNHGANEPRHIGKPATRSSDLERLLMSDHATRLRCHNGRTRVKQNAFNRQRVHIAASPRPMFERDTVRRHTARGW